MWGSGGKSVGKSRNISFNSENVKRPKRKVMSVNTALIQQHIPGEDGGSGEWERVGRRWELFLIRWYGFIISLSPEQGAGWLTGLPGGGWADGANGIRMLGPHLSVLMVGWQALMDRRSWRPAWQSRSADELWNETDTQKLWAAGPGLTPPSQPAPPPPRSTGALCTTARAATLTSIFHRGLLLG